MSLPRARCSHIVVNGQYAKGSLEMAKRLTTMDLIEAKRSGRKIVAVSCYDYTTARLVAEAGADMILMGDSAAEILLGFESTLPASMDFMVLMTSAVRRGAPNVYLVADMPFLSYQVGVAEAVRNAGRFVVEAGVQMVKVEISKAYLDVVKALSDAGMAVMAHIGIRPQTIGKLGRLRAEGTTADVALELAELAGQAVEAGATALLVEGTAAEAASLITGQTDVPVIGCGSGPGCDGQILIAPDILGLTERRPKFATSFANLAAASIEAFGAYAQHVREGTFPDATCSYHMKPGELDQLRSRLHP
jgi:3-methyl-2-oxobutanoate hydroxymethyltransferase